MKKKLIICSIIMFVSFFLSALFFFNSGFFDMNKGQVTQENVESLEIDLDNVFNTRFGGSNTTAGYINETINLDLSLITEIEITGISTEIIIESTTSNDATFNLVGYGKGNYLEKLTENNKTSISIVYPRSISFFDFSRKDLTLYVKIPENYNKELEVNTVSGKISIKDLDLDNCEIETTSGKINLEKTFCEESIMESVSGKIEMTEGNLDFTKTISGNIELNEITINKDTELKSISGKITLNPTEDSSFNINFDSTSGNFEGVDNNGEFEIKVKTTSGNLEII